MLFFDEDRLIEEALGLLRVVQAVKAYGWGNI